MATYENEIKHVPLKEVIRDCNQPRTDTRTVGVEDLGKNIVELGQMQPVLVERVVNGKVTGGVSVDGKYGLADGERRHRGLEAVGEKLIAIRIVQFDDLVDKMEVQLASDTKRLRNNLHEMAQFMRRFGNAWKDLGKKGDVISRLVELTGFSRKYFEDCGCILAASKEMQKAIKEGRVGDYSASEIQHAVGGKTDDHKAVQAGLEEGYIESQKVNQKRQEERYKEKVAVLKEQGKTAIPEPPAPAKGMGANAVRQVKGKVRRLVSNPNYTLQQKKDGAKRILLQTVGIVGGGKQVEPGDFVAYRAKFFDWLEEIGAMRVVGLSQTQVDILSGDLSLLSIRFREKCRNEAGVTPRAVRSNKQ